MSGQSSYYARAVFFFFFFIVDSRSGGTFDMEAQKGSDDLLFSLILLQWDISAAIFFHVP